MTSISKTTEKPNLPQPKAKKTPVARPGPTAQEKAQAVLAVWTDRCKGSDVCRQFNINWMTFNCWQQRAMEGMLQALEPRVNLAHGQVLSPRLRALLQKQQRSVEVNKISLRLEQLQQNKVANPVSPAAKATP